MDLAKSTRLHWFCWVSIATASVSRFGRLKGTAQAKHLLKLQCDGQRANTQLTTCLQAVERDMDERNEGLTLLVEESSAGESRVGCCL